MGKRKDDRTATAYNGPRKPRATPVCTRSPPWAANDRKGQKASLESLPESGSVSELPRVSGYRTLSLTPTGVFPADSTAEMLESRFSSVHFSFDPKIILPSTATGRPFSFGPGAKETTTTTITTRTTVKTNAQTSLLLGKKSLFANACSSIETGVGIPLESLAHGKVGGSVHAKSLLANRSG
ncbi:alpha-L-arabinofuranosidase [Anopheles sinensis]|uniref:Alpha-L-arabinofuranosidase n=1 Tax=Anopheles sinensis TaxID=74873 RepID=A0A084WE27_ANOSI|nr:alpha-L-arabinofuranosidase [Anopheles sinensis]